MLLIGCPRWAQPCTKSSTLLWSRWSSFKSNSSRGNISRTQVEQRVNQRYRSCQASTTNQTISSDIADMARSFPPIGTLQAVLFDVDGTLTDSDPLHYISFRDMLVDEGYMGGKPITEEFFSKYISGKFNDDIGQFLFPDWEESRQKKWLDDKEAHFRKLAANQLVGTPGLYEFTDWIVKKNLRRAAVTNAPRANAEQMIAGVGLNGFFEHVVVGAECDRGKPFPDPYLKALKLLGIPPEQAVVFEDSVSGIKAAVGADLPVVGVISGNPESDLVEAGVAFAIKSFYAPALWSALGEPGPL